MRHPPPYVLLEVSPAGMWQPIAPPQATASCNGSLVLPIPSTRSPLSHGHPCAILSSGIMLFHRETFPWLQHCCS